MHNNHAQPAQHSQGEPPEGVQRLELLIRRFSPAEIQCLSLLQLLLRHRPSALDFPLEEPRLQFARWLVEHGRLSEEVGTSQDGQLPAGEASDAARVRGRAPEPSRTLVSEAGVRESPMDSTGTTGGEHWYSKLLRAWSALRRGSTTVAQFGHEVERTDYPPREPHSCWTNDTRGPICPGSSGGVARSSSNVPWLWARFRRSE